LEEKVQAVADVRAPAPPTADVAVAMLKRYLTAPVHRIRLHDLVTGEADAVARWVRADHTATYNEDWGAARLREQMRLYEGRTHTLRALMAAGMFHDDGTHAEIWTRVLHRLALAADPALVSPRTQITWYPALLLMYAGGLAAMAAGRYENLARLFHRTSVRLNGQEQHVLVRARPTLVYNDADVRDPRGFDRQPVALHRHLWEFFTGEMDPYLPNHDDYTETFDLFEYLSSTVQLDVGERYGEYTTPQPGCFVWRYVGRPQHPSLRLQQLAVRPDSWLSTSGFFPEIANFNRAARQVDAQLEHR
jgi:hypothetical protein